MISKRVKQFHQARVRGPIGLFAACAMLMLSLLGASYAWADANSTSAANESAGGLEEIVVTAERREENLQRAPIPISVVGAQALQDAGVSSQEDLTRLIPSVTIYQGGQGSTQASLRGVGNLAGNTFAEQAIAFSVDGVYIARGEAIAGNFFDLDRVEVLKGPQGTLYGRNTNAGAINIITQKPLIGEFGGNAEVEVGNFDAYKLEAALNLPIGAQSAFRVAGQRVYHAGYLSDGYNDQDETDGRINWLWKPNTDVSLRIGGNYTDRRGKGDASALMTGQNGDFIGPSAPSQQALWIAAGFNPVQPNGHLSVIDKGVNAQLDWVTPLGTLTVLPAYLSASERALHYSAGFPVTFNQSSETKSVEIRLASPADQTLTWILGGYYFHENASFTLEANQTSFNALNIFPDITTRSYAGFGQGTLKMAEGLRLIFGARYTKEEKTAVGETTVGFSAGYGPPVPPGPPICAYFTPTPVAGLPTGCFAFVNNSLNASKVTWKAGLEYDINSTSMLYATASTGFKAGGFFATQNGTFKPEILTAYTLGSKNRFLNNRLQFNVEAYYWLYKDKQVSHLGPLPGSGNLDLVTDNAGNATLYGLEPEISFLFTDQDQVSATVAYEHAIYDTFLYRTVAPGPTGPDVCPASAAGFAANGAPLVSVNCSGFDVTNSPKWTITAAYRHTFQLGNGGTVVGELTGHYRSSDIAGEEQTRSEHIPGYTTEDALLTYNHPGGHWAASAFVNNLSNKESFGSSFFVGSVPSAGAPVGPLGPDIIINAPRTYGLRLNAKF